MRAWGLMVMLACGAGGCISSGQKAKVCRSLAQYPLEIDAEMLQVRVYHPDKLTPGAGDSMCLVEHQDRSVVCTSRGGLWACSPAFRSR